MKIAICDDEISVLNEIKSLLAEYCKDYDREISCDVFQSPLELLTKMEQSGCYDALFLDIPIFPTVAPIATNKTEPLGYV